VARWIPDKNKISDKEILGRRAFGQGFETAEGAKVPKGHFRLDVFWEDRLNEDLSLDRLGLKEPNPSVLRHLDPICLAHAQRKKKPFLGWAGLRAADIAKLPVRPSEDPVYKDQNPYHADLVLDDFRSKALMETLAFRLVHHAQRIGLIARIPNIYVPSEACCKRQQEIWARIEELVDRQRNGDSSTETQKKVAELKQAAAAEGEKDMLVQGFRMPDVPPQAPYKMDNRK
jgi:hypothetical protein